MRHRLGLGRRRRLLAGLRPRARPVRCRQAGARVRQQRLLIALERDAIVAALADDGRDRPAIAVQRIPGDDLALEVDQPQHLESGIDLVAVLGRDRGERQPDARRIGRDHHSGRAFLALVVAPFNDLPSMAITPPLASAATSPAVI